MTKLNRLILVPIIMVVLAGCVAKKDNQISEVSIETGSEVSIILKEDDKEFDSKKVMVKEDTSLYDVLKDNYIIEDKQGFITSIDGRRQQKKENKYWLYTINGKQAKKGVKETKVSAGDDVIFDLSKLD